MLVNGSPSDFFHVLVVIMETLSCMVEAAIVGVFLSDFLMGNANDGLITLSHLHFIDDTLIFSDADCGQIQTLRPEG